MMMTNDKKVDEMSCRWQCVWASCMMFSLLIVFNIEEWAYQGGGMNREILAWGIFASFGLALLGFLSLVKGNLSLPLKIVSMTTAIPIVIMNILFISVWFVEK